MFRIFHLIIGFGFLLLLSLAGNVYAVKPCYDPTLDEKGRFDDCKIRADRGNKVAAKALAGMYRRGEGTEKNYDNAARLYKQAGGEWNQEALFRIGKMYQNGNGSSHDYLKAYTYLQMALVLEIGLHSDFGGPSPLYYASRTKVAKELSQLQIHKAKVDINELLEKQDKSIGLDYDAFDFWMRAEKRRKENADNYRITSSFYSYAVENGNKEAQRRWVNMFQRSSKFVGYDERDFRYYKNNVQKEGSKYKRESQFGLAYLYFHGKEVEQDKSQALKWYEGAAITLESLKGYPYKKDVNGFNIIAMYLAAWMYDTAQGIPQDYKQAFSWYQRAADLGYGDAQLRLAEMYQQGQGVEQSNQLAIQWYKTAAEQGYNKAQRVLADLYRDGILVEQDKKQAFEWYKKAAVLEELDAQYALAQMYATGEGVAKNATYAYLFSNYLAQQYSYIEAQQLSTELVKEMTEIDLALEKEWGEQWLHDAKYRTLGVAVEPPFGW